MKNTEGFAHVLTKENENQAKILLGKIESTKSKRRQKLI